MLVTWQWNQPVVKCLLVHKIKYVFHENDRTLIKKELCFDISSEELFIVYSICVHCFNIKTNRCLLYYHGTIITVSKAMLKDA